MFKKLMFAAAAAVTMTFTAQAAKTAKAVVEEKGATLRFVYDGKNYGTKGTDWFSVAEAETIDPYDDNVPWYGKWSTVTKVVFDPSFAAYRPKQCGSWFFDFGFLAAVDGLKNLDTSDATNMAYMFGVCSSLTTLDVTRFNTAKVTSMEGMFYGCSALTTLDVTRFNTAKVTDMRYMFYCCSSLEAICASDQFVTDQVLYSSSMFGYCSKIKGGAGTAYDNTKTDKTYARIDGEGGQLGYFTRAPTAKVVVEDGGATLRFVYDNLDIYGEKNVGWFSVAEAEAINPYSNHVPWYGCHEDVTKAVFDSSFADYRPTQCGKWFYCFESLSAIEGIGNLDTSAATSLADMFCGCPSLTSLDVTGFDTANVTSMYGMFSRTSLTSLDLSGFDTSKVTDMGYMLYNCSSLVTIFTSDAFVTTAVTDSSNMFTLSTKLVGGAGTGYDSTKKDKTYARIDGGPSAPGYFTRRDWIAKAVVADGGKTLRFVYDGKNYGIKDTDWFSVAEAEMINPDGEDVPWYGKMWSKVTKVVFAESFAAYQPKSVASWFYNFTKLTALEGVAYWDTSKATTFYALFANCSGLTTLDLAGLSTTSAKNLGSMFNGCTSLTTICASDAFDTSASGNSNNMFKNCTALVGGNGTAFDGNKTNGEYARIDGGPSSATPGYFTLVPKVVLAGRHLALDLVKDRGIGIPKAVDYAAGDKVTVKVEGLAKGLKVVATPVYVDPKAKKKVIADYVYTIEGVPTEAIDFAKQPMYARVTTTYKDKTKTADGTGKAETLQPIVLSIATPEPSVLTAGVLNQVYGPVDIAALWPEVADAKVNPKDWSFKGWLAGLKYNATAKDASWSYKDGKATVKATAAPYTVYGQPTKAGEYPITATWKHKLADGKTTVSETFSAVLTVWGDDGASDFRYEDQAYGAAVDETLADAKSVSGLPTGLKFKAGQVTGTPTKPGVFAVTVTKTDNTKETFLWEVAPPDAPAFALDTGTAPVEDLKAQIVQGANQSFSIATSDIAAKVTVTGLPTGLKLVQNTTTKLYSVEGVASKPGEYFVTFKTVLNGVTTVTTKAFTVEGNPFTATYRGYACARPAAGAAYRFAVAEVTVAAAGTVTLTYTEGKTKYTASVKSFDWDDATGKGTAEGLVLKVSSADKKLGYGDRKATLTFTDFGAYVYAKLDIADANGSSLVESNGSMYATVKTTEATLPASQTFVFQVKDGADTNALATVSVAYDAKKATAAFSGKLYDGTAVKATVPVMRWDDDGKAWDYAFAPFLVVAKDGTVYCFDYFSSGYGGYIEWVYESGYGTEVVRSTRADYTLGDKKFAELVPNTGSFTFGWGSDTAVVGEPTEWFLFEVTTDAKGNPAGVAIYDANPQSGEKPLATVTAKVGKTTGAISVSFTSKKNDKAKYAVELVWRGPQLFAGHVTRTWKGGKVSYTAYGTADVK